MQIREGAKACYGKVLVLRRQVAFPGWHHAHHVFLEIHCMAYLHMTAPIFAPILVYASAVRHSAGQEQLEYVCSS